MACPGLASDKYPCVECIADVKENPLAVRGMVENPTIIAFISYEIGADNVPNRTCKNSIFCINAGFILLNSTWKYAVLRIVVVHKMETNH